MQRWNRTSRGRSTRSTTVSTTPPTSKALNDALAKLEEARANEDHSAIFLNEKNLAFHLGGHVNHSIWWKNLSPDGGDKPTGDLAAAIDDAFGSFDKFRAQFSAAANGLQGSGWAVLGYDTLGDRLLTFQLYDQQANVPLGIIPLLQVDMWEHAFYLQYKNVKADYVKAFWNVVNWADVQTRYAAATSKTTGPDFPLTSHLEGLGRRADRAAPLSFRWPIVRRRDHACPSPLTVSCCTAPKPHGMLDYSSYLRPTSVVIPSGGVAEGEMETGSGRADRGCPLSFAWGPQRVRDLRALAGFHQGVGTAAMVAVRVASLPGLLSTTTVFGAREELPDEPEPEPSAWCSPRARSSVNQRYPPGYFADHQPPALLMLHPPSETTPSLPECTGAASGCVLLPGLPYLGLEHRAAWVEAEADGTVTSMVSRVGVDPISHPDTAILAMLLAA